MSEEQDKQHKPEKKAKAPTRRIDPKLSNTVLRNLTSIQYKRLLIIKSDRQEQPKPEKPVPPRQDDPLLGDYAEKGDKPNRETKEK
jgi:hypothetical protein